MKDIKKNKGKNKTKKKRKVSSKDTFLYLVKSERIITNKYGKKLKKLWTYTGVTNDLRRRLRQHNGKIKGGARYTRGKKFISGFPDRKTALQYEWRTHHPSRIRKGKNPLTKRLKQINAMMFMKKVTKKSIPHEQLELTINWIKKYKYHVEKECIEEGKPLEWTNNIKHKLITINK
jgi:predicted GIY-YIG superfamily endonuclease